MVSSGGLWEGGGGRAGVLQRNGRSSACLGAAGASLAAPWRLVAAARPFGADMRCRSAGAGAEWTRKPARAVRTNCETAADRVHDTLRMQSLFRRSPSCRAPSPCVVVCPSAGSSKQAWCAGCRWLLLKCIRTLVVGAQECQHWSKVGPGVGLC